MIRTKLIDASKELPNFAEHYRFAIFRCGSECAAGAVIDLQTGTVFPPPLGGRGDGWGRWTISAAMVEGSAIDFRVNSRLVVVKAGLNYSEARNANVPDEHYFVLEGNRFLGISYVSGKKSLLVPPQ